MAAYVTRESSATKVGEGPGRTSAFTHMPQKATKQEPRNMLNTQKQKLLTTDDADFTDEETALRQKDGAKR